MRLCAQSCRNALALRVVRRAAKQKGEARRGEGFVAGTGGRGTQARRPCSVQHRTGRDAGARAGTREGAAMSHVISGAEGGSRHAGLPGPAPRLVYCIDSLAPKYT